MINLRNAFGFRQVAAEDKTRLVQQIFTEVSSKYNLMNDAMSLGLHRWWKRKFIEQVVNHAQRYPHERTIDLIDVAGGTGDIGLGCYRQLVRAPRQKINFTSADSNRVNITICDLNEAMLAEGKQAAYNQGIVHGVQWHQVNAEQLPFADHSVDIYTVAFGLRNFTHIDVALAEARRVLRADGRLFILEFSQVESQLLKDLYQFYAFKIIPRLGQVLANNRSAYQYLVESIELFPTPAVLREALIAAGFTNVNYELLSKGIAAIHTAS